MRGTLADAYLLAFIHGGDHRIGLDDGLCRNGRDAPASGPLDYPHIDTAGDDVIVHHFEFRHRTRAPEHNLDALARHDEAAIVALDQMPVVHEHEEPIRIDAAAIPSVVEVQADGTDVDAQAGPRAGNEFLVRRHWHPAGVVIAFAPDDPRRRPCVSGHPQPLPLRIVHPAAVVIDDVVEWVVGDPIPAIFVGEFPIAVRVWLEIWADQAWPRPPHIAPDRMARPSPGMGEAVVE